MITRKSLQGGSSLEVNVGSKDWNFEVIDLAEEVVSVIPDVKIEINKSAPPDKRSYKVNFDLYEKLAPLHQPKEIMREAIEELEVGVRTMGFLGKDFRKSNFVRLMTLSDHLEYGRLKPDLRWGAQ